RQNNIFKASTVLGLALEKKQSCYVFEIYSDNLDYFTSKLKQLDSEAKYLKLEIESHIKLMIFTTKAKAEVLDLMTSINPDFILLHLFDDLKRDAVTVAGIAYNLAENFLVPKAARKEKQFSGSDLTEDEKKFALEFELTPRVVRFS
ncbi:hypothetical protein, partial [Acinetobacter baumannii]